MPLLKGNSPQILKQNFHELRHGKTFKRTAAKFGISKARKQMEAIALSQAGRARDFLGEANRR